MICLISSPAKVLFRAKDCSSGGSSEILLNKEGCLARPRLGTAFFNWDKRFSSSSGDVFTGIYDKEKCSSHLTV